MAFVARLDDKGLHAVLVCDAAGCGGEIDFDAADRASTVAAAPQGDAPIPLLFA